VCGVSSAVKAEGVGDRVGDAAEDVECGGEVVVGRGRRDGSGQSVVGRLRIKWNRNKYWNGHRG
jgi:hypothetical protein